MEIVKKVNTSMALRWMLFMPVILPLCLVFGALKGIVNMLEQMMNLMYSDIENSSNN